MSVRHLPFFHQSKNISNEDICVDKPDWLHLSQLCLKSTSTRALHPHYQHAGSFCELPLFFEWRAQRENGGEKVDHGSGGMILLRAA